MLALTSVYTLSTLYCGARHIYRLALGILIWGTETHLACWVWSGWAWGVLVVVVVVVIVIVYKAGRWSSLLTVDFCLVQCPNIYFDYHMLQRKLAIGYECNSLSCLSRNISVKYHITCEFIPNSPRPSHHRNTQPLLHHLTSHQCLTQLPTNTPPPSPPPPLHLPGTPPPHPTISPLHFH